MRSVRTGALCGLGLWLLLATEAGWAAEPYYMEPATLRSPASVSKTVAASLNEQGWMLYTESNGLKEPICEVFTAKSVPGQEPPTSSKKMNYGNVKPGALLGLVHLLPEATEDYAVDTHEEKLKPGYYTMRYGLMPAGTYEHGVVLGEFVVLIPAELDQDPQRILSADELGQKAAASTSAGSAATMQLVAAQAAPHKSPAVSMDDKGVCTFQVPVQVTSSNAANAANAKQTNLAIVMLTPIPHPEGS